MNAVQKAYETLRKIKEGRTGFFERAREAMPAFISTANPQYADYAMTIIQKDGYAERLFSVYLEAYELMKEYIELRGTNEVIDVLQKIYKINIYHEKKRGEELDLYSHLTRKLWDQPVIDTMEKFKWGDELSHGDMIPTHGVVSLLSADVYKPKHMAWKERMDSSVQIDPPYLRSIPSGLSIMNVLYAKDQPYTWKDETDTIYRYDKDRNGIWYANYFDAHREPQRKQVHNTRSITMAKPVVVDREILAKRSMRP